MVITMLNILLILLLCLIAFNFGAYPLLLRIIAKFRKVEHNIDPNYRPTVTLLMAAYNEGDVLQQKLENSLALDYPKDLLEILVISDGSTDETNSIASQFESRGVTVKLNAENKGKATVLNMAMEMIDSDIVVLSDANVMYEKDAILNLVRHFSDPGIGAVSGKVVLLNEDLSYSDAENQYYLVEHSIQQLESQTGNLIGADGGMYAIRSKLLRPLPADAHNDDFVLSMGVIQKNKRLIFDPTALGFEENTAEMNTEYNRKVRIVVSGIRYLKLSWPPKGHLLTAVKYFLHKIIRWYIGPVIIAFVLLLLLKGVITKSAFTLALALAAVVGFPLLVVMIKLFPSLKNIKLIGIIHYLMIMVTASTVGCYKALVTRETISWSSAK